MIWGIIGRRNIHGSVRLNDQDIESPPPSSPPLSQITINSTSNQPSQSAPIITTLQSNRNPLPNWKSLIYINNFQHCLKQIIETNSILNLTEFKTNLIYGFYFKVILISFLAVILVLFFYFLEAFSKELPNYFFSIKGVIIVLSLAVIMILIIQLDTRLIKIKNAVKEIDRNRLHTPSPQTTTTATHTSYSTLPRYVEACDIPPMYSTVNLVRSNNSVSSSSSSSNSSIPRAILRGSNESLN